MNNITATRAFAQQSNIRNVNIVQGASSLTNDAFSPNPIEVSAGTTVIWTNQDSNPHTVTSGSAAAGDGLFNSPILTRGMQFNYTFSQEGNFPYYCSLHPNMVGTVTATGNGGVAPPPIKLTVQTDKPAYQMSETVTVTGSAPRDSIIMVRILDPTGSVYRVDQVTASSTGSYSYLFDIGGPLAMEGKYQVAVASGGQQAQTGFTVEKTVVQNPSISLTLINNKTPRFDIDTVEISGTVSVECSGSAVALICPPQTGTVFWGDGTVSTFDANDSPNWGPLKHTFSSAGPTLVSVSLSEKDKQEDILAQDTADITVMKHKTSLSAPKLSSYTIQAGQSFQVLQTVLTDDDSQKPIGGKTISFSGSALADKVSGVGMDNGDFVFPVQLQASDNSGNAALQASFAGDNQYEPSDSAQVQVEIKAAPMPPPISPPSTASPSPDCVSGLQCFDPTVIIIVCIVLAGGAIVGYKILKKSPPKPDDPNRKKEPEKQVPKPNVVVRGKIKGYIELGGERFDGGGL
jgi:plastocyanin